MKFAIIAAGEGSRLSAEGVQEPKPLVKVGGEHLIDRLMRVFVDNGADEVLAICNDRTSLVSRHLQRISEEGLGGRAVPLRYVVKSTPSSMHSFFELSSMLGDSPFVLTTVDTIFREAEFSAYVVAFASALAKGQDGLMGVTDYVDDEKPLYVGTDEQMNITGFYDDNSLANRFISGGIYGLAPFALRTLDGCMRRGESRMRNFQRSLIRDGRRLKAHVFSKVFDIDHASDIAKAESFLKLEGENRNKD